jgi:hypothetical protein
MAQILVETAPPCDCGHGELSLSTLTLTTRYFSKNKNVSTYSTNKKHRFKNKNVEMMHFLSEIKFTGASSSTSEAMS